jgi:hypothetical protein
MFLPRHFCWTRFGTEAGQDIGAILARKEAERQANEGVFLWGIGNAIGPSISELLRREQRPEVVFSPIRSDPRSQDVAPDRILVWRRGVTLSGRSYALPPASMVTSGVARTGPRPRRYALVCRSARALEIDAYAPRMPFDRLRNLLTGRPVGWSQVTAVVRVVADTEAGREGIEYALAIRAELVSPYLVELVDPATLSENSVLLPDQLTLLH